MEKAHQIEKSWASSVIGTISAFEGSVIEKAKAALGMSSDSVIPASTWAEVDKAEEIERTRRIQAKVDPMIEAKKMRVERELLSKISS